MPTLVLAGQRVRASVLALSIAALRRKPARLLGGPGEPFGRLIGGVGGQPDNKDQVLATPCCWVCPLTSADSFRQAGLWPEVLGCGGARSRHCTSPRGAGGFHGAEITADISGPFWCEIRIYLESRRGQKLVTKSPQQALAQEPCIRDPGLLSSLPAPVPAWQP